MSDAYSPLFIALHPTVAADLHLLVYGICNKEAVVEDWTEREIGNGAFEALSATGYAKLVAPLVDLLPALARLAIGRQGAVRMTRPQAEALFHLLYGLSTGDMQLTVVAEPGGAMRVVEASDIGALVALNAIAPALDL